MLQRNSSKRSNTMYGSRSRLEISIPKANFIVASVHYLGGIGGSTNTGLVICIKKK